MGFVSASLENMILITFHYVRNNISSDWITAENDPAIDELLSNGFNYNKTEAEKGITIYLQNAAEIFKASTITNYPHFLSLKN